MLKTAIISLTKKGIELAGKISDKLKSDVFGPVTLIDNEPLRNGIAFYPITENFGQFVGKIFSEYQALIFIMACGIVVRSIAPYLKDKKQDPAVVVMDEKGQFAISLLSGHWGHANELAQQVAAITGGQPVLTTATDVNGIIAWDVFARKYDWVIEDGLVLKQVSSILVNGGSVNLFSDCRIEGQLPSYIQVGQEGKKGRYAVVLSNATNIKPEFETVLYLRPVNLILGIGCRKGISKKVIAESVADYLARNHKSMLSVKKLVSVDLKANESAILDYSREQNLPFITIAVKSNKESGRSVQLFIFCKENRWSRWCRGSMCGFGRCQYPINLY